MKLASSTPWMKAWMRYRKPFLRKSAVHSPAGAVDAVTASSEVVRSDRNNILEAMRKLRNGEDPGRTTKLGDEVNI